MLPLAFVDLTRLSGKSGNGPTGKGVLRYTAVAARRLIILAAITLVLLGSGVSVLGL